MGRTRKPLPPRKNRDGTVDHPDLWYDWLAAKIAAKLGDVSSVSLSAGAFTFALFAALWFGSPEGSTLRTVFAIATTVCAVGMVTAWSAKIWRTEMGDEWAIITHGGVVFAIGCMVTVILVAGWWQDTTRSSVRRADADKQRRDAEVAQAAQDEAARRAKIADEATKRAHEDEAARQRAQAATQACLLARDDAIQKATKSLSSARKAAEDCQTQWRETMLTFQNDREFCKGPYARFDSAKGQLADAKSKSCGEGTDTTGSVDKPK